MNWYRADVGLPTHPKVFRLAAALVVPRLHAVGIVHAMLAWAATLDSEEVELPAMEAASVLAHVCDYVGDPTELLGALGRSGWIDMVGTYDNQLVRVHNWGERNGSQVRDTKAARLRMQKAKTSPKPSTKPSTKPSPLPTHVPTHPRTDGRTAISNAVQKKKAEGLPAAPGGPQAALVQAFADVYEAHEGKPYRHQQADFVLAAPLAAQGVTPQELSATAERAWRHGVSGWLAVRSFKQLATRYADVAAAQGKMLATSADFDEDPLFNKTHGGAQ